MNTKITHCYKTYLLDRSLQWSLGKGLSWSSWCFRHLTHRCHLRCKLRWGLLASKHFWHELFSKVFSIGCLTSFVLIQLFNHCIVWRLRIRLWRWGLSCISSSETKKRHFFKAEQSLKHKFSNAFSCVCSNHGLYHKIFHVSPPPLLWKHCLVKCFLIIQDNTTL